MCVERVALRRTSSLEDGRLVAVAATGIGLLVVVSYARQTERRRAVEEVAVAATGENDSYQYCHACRRKKR